MDHSRGIKSVEIGYRVLLAVQRGPAAVQLTEVARRAELSTGAAHNYLTSLGRVGLVEREGRGSYRLGPSAFALSLASFKQLKNYDLMRQAAMALYNRTGLAVATSVWSQAGPISVFTQQGKDAPEFEFRSGLLSLLRTAASRLFLAKLPPEQTMPLLEEELKRHCRDPAEAPAIRNSAVVEYEANGFAQWDYFSDVGDRITSLAAPVYRTSDEISFGLSVLGARELVHPDANREPLAALQEITRTFSQV